MRNIAFIKYSILLALLVGFLPNVYCEVIYGAEFRYHRMNLSNNISSKIIPLKSIDSNIDTNPIMGSFFTAGSDNNNGFYTIKISSQYSGPGPKSTGIMTNYIIVSGLTLCLTMPLLPYDENRFKLTATVTFYDVNKKQIGEFSDSTVYDALEFFGRTTDYTFKTEHLFRNLIKNCLNAASRDSENINKLLIEAKYPQPPIETAAHNAFNDLKSKIPKCNDVSCNAIAIISANKNMDAIAGNMYIENHLLKSEYHIVDRAKIDFIIAELQLSNSPFVSNEDAIRIGRLVSAKYLIFVQIAGEGTNRMINFRVSTVETGKVVTSYNSRYKN